MLCKVATNADHLRYLRDVEKMLKDALATPRSSEEQSQCRELLCDVQIRIREHSRQGIA